LPLLLGGATVLFLDVARRLFRLTKLFVPSRAPLTTWNPEDYGMARAETEEVWIESDDGEMLYGWYCRAKNPIASALYCHGNTGNLTNPAHLMPHLLDSGINVLLFDYRGYGRSTGRPTVHGVIADTVAAARFHEKIRPQNLPSILYGFSIGGAIAAQVIRYHSFDGLILQSTFTSLPDIARVAFPRLPMHLFSGRLFDTASVVRNLRIPLLIIHGQEDEVCPCWMADALYDACQGDKQICRIEGGLHKNLWERDPDTLTRAIHDFAAGLSKSPHVITDPPRLRERVVDAAFRFLRRHVRRRSALRTV
jgi:alpha-beta hydrolase superfamily lysophospholipase